MLTDQEEAWVYFTTKDFEYIVASEKYKWVDIVDQAVLNKMLETIVEKQQSEHTN